MSIWVKNMEVRNNEATWEEEVSNKFETGQRWMNMYARFHKGTWHKNGYPIRNPALVASLNYCAGGRTITESYIGD